ncbi:MAG: outer membrane protein transport protein, partial [Bacteroidia bacterium]|nr:outer membrane protein transport protein [Bacteroidia bacterium]
ANFFSFLDTKRTVKQTRDIVTKGRQKEFNFSVAHTFKDNFYIGASIGVPVINFTSTTTHIETDEKDSMQVTITSPIGKPVTYTTSYVDGLPTIYTGLLGFSSLEYTEYFRTNGTGINLKIGAIYRVNDMFRVGFNYQSKSYYNLTDVYFNSMTTRFDKPGSYPIMDTVPKGRGYYKYKLVTPSRVALSGAFIYKKLGLISVDYEMVNYGKAQLNGANASDFSTANNAIQKSFGMAQNIRIGAELNIKPMMLRLGYNMQGSPYGAIFTGNYVRNTVSLGVGFRNQKNLFFDLAWFKTLSKEDYYMFRTLNTKSSFVFNNTSIAATIGRKF